MGRLGDRRVEGVGGRGGSNGEFYFFETIRGASKKRAGQKKLKRE